MKQLEEVFLGLGNWITYQESWLLSGAAAPRQPLDIEQARGLYFALFGPEVSGPGQSVEPLKPQKCLDPAEFKG